MTAELLDLLVRNMAFHLNQLTLLKAKDVKLGELFRAWDYYHEYVQYGILKLPV